MITHIKGILIEKTPTEVVIETNGVGYSINISLNTFSRLGEEDNIKLFTHQIIKEDSHSLYGFYEKSERFLFVADFCVRYWGQYSKNNVIVVNYSRNNFCNFRKWC